MGDGGVGIVGELKKNFEQEFDLMKPKRNNCANEIHPRWGMVLIISL